VSLFLVVVDTSNSRPWIIDPRPHAARPLHAVWLRAPCGDVGGHVRGVLNRVLPRIHSRSWAGPRPNPADLADFARSLSSLFGKLKDLLDLLHF
jgi:hypothetical protein